MGIVTLENTLTDAAVRDSKIPGFYSLNRLTFFHKFATLIKMIETCFKQLFGGRLWQRQHR